MNKRFVFWLINLGLGVWLGCAITAGADWFVRTDGSDSALGTSWTEAFATVSNALAHAADTDVILVSNGVYELTAALTINAAVTLRSVNGSTVTTLRRDGSATHRIITMTHADALVEGFTIADGRAGGNPEVGSGIHMTGGTVRSCIITNNLASQRQARGGGVYMNGGVLEDCVIVDNRANASDGNAYGSAVLATGGALIQHCRIYGNQVNGSYTSARGAVYLDSGANILRNSLIYGNQAGGSIRPTPTPGHKVAGVYSEGTANRVEYCTIAGNVSQYGIGVGLYMHRGHALNNIVYFNHPEFRGDYRMLHENAYATPDRADTSISYTCAYPLVDGDGNTAVDPLFANWQNGDFRLLPESPALDTADPIIDVTTDFYGVERDRDGNGDSTGAPDMGAIEAEAANAGPLRCSLVAAVNEAVGPAEFTYTAHVAGSNTTGLTYAWDFENDDAINASGATADYTFGVGWHDVKLTVSNAANDSVTLVRENEARIAPALIYVTEDGDHVFPFASPADAATNVQSAVNAALATETAVSEVLVNDGHYLLERQVIVDKGIVLRSENGAEITILDAQQVSGRRVMELYQGAADAVVDGFTLQGGRAQDLAFGGGINMYAGAVQHCVITNNHSSGRQAQQGGGVRMFGGILRGCMIVDNHSSGGDGGAAGGGVWASGGGALIDRCRIENNRATASTSYAYGGGVYLTGNAILRNSIVAGNYANNNPGTHRGAGVYVNHADSRVENCTIVDNTIDAGDSAGMYQNNGTVVNAILWRNYMVGLEHSLPDHKNYVFINGSMTYCNSYPLSGGAGNIDSDPMFIDRVAGDYRLSIGSPAIDAGTPLAAVTNDFAGVSRPLDGNDDGTPMHDIGAFEFDPALIDTLTCSFSTEPSQGVDSIDAVFSAFVAGPGADNVVYYWDFNNDGFFETEGADKAVVTNTYGIGVYSVKLMVSNLVEQTGATRLEENYIHVIPSTVYVATDGQHVTPFHTPENAATNIHDAVNAVVSGGEVLIGAGTYGISEQIALTRPLTVRGIDGPETTIIEQTAETARIFRLSDSDALIEGLTIRGGSVGNMEYGGGVYVAAGTVRACIVTGNNAGGRFSEGGGIYLTAGGLVENTLIVGNRDSGGDRSQGGGIRMTGGIVRNCTITGNSVNREGGGIFRTGGFVINSIITGNIAVNEIGNHDVHGLTTAFAYSCSPDLTDGVDGNITADPQFIDPGEGYGLTHVVGDYRLDYAISPAMDAGLNQPWMLDAVDLAGLPRILMGTVDMGCYETPPPRGTVILFR